MVQIDIQNNTVFYLGLHTYIVLMIRKPSQTWAGEGNGNPLHCSCLENPRDGGAWWAAVYGVTQSRP